MNDFIKDLFYGKFRPSEREMPCTKEYHDAVKHSENTINKAISIMNKNHISNADIMNDDIINSWIDIENFAVLNAFEDGIKLGLELGKLIK